MSLVDFFRPKWKHSDAAVRAEAVKGMGPADADKLVRIALDDADGRVRELAIKRIESPDTLMDIAGSAEDGELAALAKQRAGELLVNDAVQGDDLAAAEGAVERIDGLGPLADVVKRATFESVRLAALARLDDDKILADVARSAKREETRIAAAERISDQGVLRSLALDAKREIALAALTRLDDLELLAEVAKRSKVKSVRTRAQRKLEELRPAPVRVEAEPSEEVRQEAAAEREAAKRRAKVADLCARIEALRDKVAAPSTLTALDEIEAAWLEATSKGAVDPAVERRFVDARHEIKTKNAEAVEARAADEARRAAAKAALDALQALVERAEALPEEGIGEALSALEAELSALEPVDGREAEGLERRFAEVVRKRRGRLEAEARRAAARPELEALLPEVEALADKPLKAARRELGALRRRWRQIAGRGGAEQDLEARWEAVEAKLKEREAGEREERDRERAEAKLQAEDVTTRLEAAAESSDLRLVDNLIKEAKEVSKRAQRLLGRREWDELAPRFNEAERALSSRLSELREADEWNRHFNQRKQEELCQRVEALLEVEDKAEAARQLRAAQQEWKAVGRGPRGRSADLWDRFKKAGDAVYEKCGDHFETVKKEREDNLARKVAICEEAESLAQSTDWKATADRLKALQEEWKAVGPVRRKDSDAVWKRFRAACDTFFDARKEHFKELDSARTDNLTKKKELCERAEALQDSSDWKEAAEALRALQAEWKAVGPVPRKHSDAIWKRFRAACDRFFARREAHLDGGRQANLSRKDQICEELETALEGAGWDSDAEAALPEQVLAAYREWKEIGPIPFDEVERTQARLDAVVAKAIESYPERFAGTELDPEAAAQKRERLCERLEALADKLEGEKARDEAEASEERSVAERLREAMARNTFSKESKAEDKAQGQEELSRVRRSFRSAAPVAGERGAALASRFDAALRRVYAIVGEPSDTPEPGSDS